MTLLLAAALGLAIGAVLGALGGGGAVLTVPALVHLLGQSAQDATTGSLVVVGATAAVGALSHARAGHVAWRTAGVFAATGLLAAVAGTAANRAVDESVLLLGFAVLLVVAAGAMLAKSRNRHAAPAPAPVVAGHGGGGGDAAPPDCEPGTGARGRRGTGPSRRALALRTAGAGVGVGFLTGFFGVGGGFVIVPALTLLLGMATPLAVGTSLVVIAANSGVSLAARVGDLAVDWAVIGPFLAGALVGVLVGKALAGRLPEGGLDRAFALLLLAVAGYTAVTTVAGAV